MQLRYNLNIDICLLTSKSTIKISYLRRKLVKEDVGLFIKVAGNIH